jgi:hypothetical protein
MEAARRFFTTVIPPATSFAAEEPVKSDQHPEEVPEERLAVAPQSSR